MASAGYTTPPRAAIRVASNKARDRQGQPNKFRIRNLPKRIYGKVGVP